MSIIEYADELCSRIRLKHESDSPVFYEPEDYLRYRLVHGVFDCLVETEEFGIYSETESIDLYYFEDLELYLVLEFFVGSCTGCIGEFYRDEDTETEEGCIEVLKNIVRKGYATKSKDDAYEYFESRKQKKGAIVLERQNRRDEEKRRRKEEYQRRLETDPDFKAKQIKSSGALVALTAANVPRRYTSAAPETPLFKNAYKRSTAFSMKDTVNFL